MCAQSSAREHLPHPLASALCALLTRVPTAQSWEAALTVGDMSPACVAQSLALQQSDASTARVGLPMPASSLRVPRGIPSPNSSIHTQLPHLARTTHFSDFPRQSQEQNRVFGSCINAVWLTSVHLETTPACLVPTPNQCLLKTERLQGGS